MKRLSMLLLPAFLISSISHAADFFSAKELLSNPLNYVSPLVSLIVEHQMGSGPVNDIINNAKSITADIKANPVGCKITVDDMYKLLTSITGVVQVNTISKDGKLLYPWIPTQPAVDNLISKLKTMGISIDGNYKFDLGKTKLSLYDLAARALIIKGSLDAGKNLDQVAQIAPTASLVLGTAANKLAELSVYKGKKMTDFIQTEGMGTFEKAGALKVNITFMLSKLFKGLSEILFDCGKAIQNKQQSVVLSAEEQAEIQQELDLSDLD